MPKVSVIIPVYNTGKYIEKCLDSIVNQTLDKKEIEIIIVNDGSTDNSDEIINKYMKSNNNTRFIYLKKENGGLSDARNFGVEHANGDYITFVDSDDYIVSNLYEFLAPYMVKSYDIIKYKIAKVDEIGNKIEDNYNPIFEDKTGEEAFDILYKSDKLLVVAWAYLYKKDFFISNNFKYPKGMYHEDFALTPLVILKANNVASTNIIGYNYVQTSNSITRGNPKIAYKRANDLLMHYDNMLKQTEDYQISKQTKQNIKTYFTNCIILEANNLQNKSEKNSYIKEIKKRKMLDNIKVHNFKQLIKKIVLNININWYLKLINLKG